MRWKEQELDCKDPFLQRIFEQRSRNSPYKYVRGDKNWSFQFDILNRKHHKGAVYILSSYGGMIQKIDRLVYGKKSEYKERDFTVIAETEALPLKEMTPEILLNFLRELEVIEIMSS
jgi:hypothetical protein